MLPFPVYRPWSDSNMKASQKPLSEADQLTLIRSINRYQCNCLVQQCTCVMSIGYQRPIVVP